MEETITFWLDNKISSGFKVAEIGGQPFLGRAQGRGGTAKGIRVRVLKLAPEPERRALRLSRVAAEMRARYSNRGKGCKARRQKRDERGRWAK